jgi:hypothetical protein
LLDGWTATTSFVSQSEREERREALCSLDVFFSWSTTYRDTSEFVALAKGPYKDNINQHCAHVCARLTKDSLWVVPKKQAKRSGSGQCANPMLNVPLKLDVDSELECPMFLFLAFLLRRHSTIHVLIYHSPRERPIFATGVSAVLSLSLANEAERVSFLET